MGEPYPPSSAPAGFVSGLSPSESSRHGPQEESPGVGPAEEPTGGAAAFDPDRALWRARGPGAGPPARDPEPDLVQLRDRGDGAGRDPAPFPGGHHRRALLAAPRRGPQVPRPGHASGGGVARDDDLA